MIFLLIADSFPPSSNSAASLINDLSIEIKDNIIVVVPNNSLLKKTTSDTFKNRKILIVRTFNSKSSSLFYRTFSELANPFLILLAIKLNGINKYDGIIWYSPSIFFGFIVMLLKANKKVKSYLILRDIFPQWALDIHLLKKGMVFYFFKFFENYQYKVADKIAVQSCSNINYFRKNYPNMLNKIEVLDNWMQKPKPVKSSINLSNTPLKNKIIFIYAGNFGKSQQIDYLLNLVYFFKENKEIGFVFVGGGSEFDRIKQAAKLDILDNLLVLSSIPPGELIQLYEQCDIGLISLDLRHKTSNIPGKFISYLLSGLPVFAIVNKGNDLIEIVNKNNIGVAFSSHSMELFEKKFLKFIHQINKKKVAGKCIAFANKNYSPKKAAKQIISFFRAD
ncbi:RfaG Glycosyltransferase [Methylophilaceae bacterium]